MTSYRTKIRERLEAATPGPWAIVDDGTDGPGWVREPTGPIAEIFGGYAERVIGNTTLIASAPTDLRRLLDDLEACQHRLEQTLLRFQLDRLDEEDLAEIGALLAHLGAE